MKYRMKKKLYKRENIWHYREYKRRIKLYKKICKRIENTDVTKSVKLVFEDIAYTDIFRVNSRIVFRRNCRFVDSITFLQAVIDFWIKTDFNTIQRTLNNIPDDLFEDKQSSFSVEVMPDTKQDT